MGFHRSVCHWQINIDVTPMVNVALQMKLERCDFFKSVWYLQKNLDSYDSLSMCDIANEIWNIWFPMTVRHWQKRYWRIWLPNSTSPVKTTITCIRKRFNLIIEQQTSFRWSSHDSNGDRLKGVVVYGECLLELCQLVDLAIFHAPYNGTLKSQQSDRYQKDILTKEVRVFNCNVTSARTGLFH